VARILVVDDDADIRRLLRDELVAEPREVGALDVVGKPFEPWLVDLVTAVLLVPPDEREQYRQGRLDQAPRR
jgi:chemotaxis response regulator CheB